MNVASYTRASSCAGDWIDADSIQDQNSRIADYVKARGWKLSKKYSDRKTDASADDAFQKMRKDCIDRKYDGVVIDSMYTCGKDLHFAADLFQYVCLTAGIAFAVVEDEFFSGDHTESEVSDYIAEKRKEFRRKIRCTAQYEKLSKRKYAKYGYRYKKNGSELEEDPQTADIVRMIFRQVADGTLPVEICAQLNEKGIEQPTYYWRRTQGMPLSGCRKEWAKEKVRYIVRNRLYLGEWKRKLYGEEKMLSCPAIIDEETFQKAQDSFSARSIKGEQKNFNGKAFYKQLNDKDSGLPLRVYTHQGRNIPVFRFGYPKPKDIVYEKTWIEYDFVEKVVISQIQAEHGKALTVQEALVAGKGEAIREKATEPYRKALQDTFQKQMALESRRFRESRSEGKEAGKDGGEFSNESYLEEIMRLDVEIRENMEKLKNAERNVSWDNPWLKLYIQEVPADALTLADVKKWTDGVVVEKFERVEATMKYQDYFSCFPSEWFKEDK